jgi:hypothetical protein
MDILMQDVENLGTINDRLQFGVHCSFSSCPALVSARRLLRFVWLALSQPLLQLNQLPPFLLRFSNKLTMSIQAVVARFKRPPAYLSEAD